MTMPFKLTTADSRGRESTTLFFVRVTWAVMVLKFLPAGIVIPDVISFPQMDVMSFGGGVAAVLAIWLGREWTEKVKDKNNTNNGEQGLGNE